MASGFSQARDCWIMGKNCTGDMGQNPPISLIPQHKAWRFTLWPGKPGRHLGALHSLDSPAGWAFDNQSFHILVLLLPRGRWSIYLFWPLFNRNSPLTSIYIYKGTKSYCSFFYILATFATVEVKKNYIDRHRRHKKFPSSHYCMLSKFHSL